MRGGHEGGAALGETSRDASGTSLPSARRTVMAESAEREKEEAKPRVSYAGNRSAMGKNVAKPRRPLFRRPRAAPAPSSPHCQCTAPLVFTHLWRNARAVDAENAAFPAHAFSASLCVNCHAPAFLYRFGRYPPSSSAQKCPEELVSVVCLSPEQGGRKPPQTPTRNRERTANNAGPIKFGPIDTRNAHSCTLASRLESDGDLAANSREPPC